MGLMKSKVLKQLSFQIQKFGIKIVTTKEKNVLDYAHFIL